MMKDAKPKQAGLDHASAANMAIENDTTPSRVNRRERAELTTFIGAKNFTARQE